MNRSEQNVRLAARIYEMRDTAKRILGERYAACVGEWVAIINRVQEREKLDVLPAVLHIQKRVVEKGKDLSDMDILLMTAAAVEMSEIDRILEQIPEVRR